MRHLFTTARAAVLAAALLAAVPLAAGADSPADEALAKAVSARLMQDKNFDATDIIVTAKDGIVHLRGDVQASSDAKAMENAAMSVPGVKRVETQIDIRNWQIPGTP